MDLQHGLRSTYLKGECRCRQCTTANTEYMRYYRDRKKAGRPVQARSYPADHGTRYYYMTRKCHCDLCSQAAAEYARSRKRKQESS